MSSEIERLVERHLRGWSEGDVEAILGCFTIDGSLEDVALEATFLGHGPIREMATRVLKAMSGLRWTPTLICVDGSMVFSEWHMTGTHSGDLPRIGPGTGRPFSVRGASVDEIRDGLIHRHRDYWNLTTYQKQVGLLT